jgi:hypothetical protein
VCLVDRTNLAHQVIIDFRAHENVESGNYTSAPQFIGNIIKEYPTFVYLQVRRNRPNFRSTTQGAAAHYRVTHRPSIR